MQVAVARRDDFAGSCREGEQRGQRAAAQPIGCVALSPNGDGRCEIARSMSVRRNQRREASQLPFSGSSPPATTKATSCLDPFCGCGTAVHAAQRAEAALDRHRHRTWPVSLIRHAASAESASRHRVRRARHATDYRRGAEATAERDRSTSSSSGPAACVNAQPYQGGRKGRRPRHRYCLTSKSERTGPRR